MTRMSSEMQLSILEKNAWIANRIFGKEAAVLHVPARRGVQRDILVVRSSRGYTGRIEQLRLVSTYH